ncbi:MAG: flagellar basal body rod protein FlgC [Candidatus Heimdallarchaeota archaeon]|nr:flagellar basal body rod protein FlgC [Candidatus Heimdallarchaeota archaeon]
MKVNGVFSALRTTLSGMSNQMKRLNAISENIANAERTPDEKGNIYNRKVVVQQSESKLRRSRFGDEMQLKMQRTNSAHMTSKSISATLDPNNQDEKFPVKIVEQKGFRVLYNPGHPRADENGYVKMPDVNPVEEMVDLIGASRTYEANVTVMDASKQMAKKALEI